MRKFPIEAIMIAFLITGMMAVFFTYKNYKSTENLNTTIQSRFNIEYLTN